MVRYKASGFRLKGVTPQTRRTFGYWGYTLKGPCMINAWINDYVVEKLAPTVVNDRRMAWGISSTASEEAQLFCQAQLGHL